MAIAAVTYSFTTATTAVAAQVNQDFTDVLTFLNSNVVHVDGSKTMTGQLALLAADPTTANQATRKSYVDARALFLGGATSSTGILGTPPASGTQLSIKAAKQTVTTDVNGDATVTLTSAFTTSIVGVLVTAIDAAGTTLEFYAVTAATLGSFSFRTFRNYGAGGALIPLVSASTSFSWLAFGF